MRTPIVRAALGLAVATLAGTGALAATPARTAAPARKASAPVAAPAPAAKPPARPLDLAYGAYQRGMYVTAYREALARVDRDPADAAAMTLIAELANQGLGVRLDPVEAARWYRLAAAKGDPHAMATLGLMSLDGRGLPRDTAAARAWFDKASALREPTAAYNLALLLLANGTEADVARSAPLLVIAAEAEIGDAQHALGVMHSRGQGGVAKDQGAAARLFLRAARNGSDSGAVEFAITLFNGDGVPKSEAGAARWFRFAAAHGNAIAQNRLARMYAAGRGVPKNLVEAAAWHLAATAQGLTDTWLDAQLRDLPPGERARAEALAAERANRA